MWGLIARADSGGLGNQTYEMYRHLRPDRTLVIAMGKNARGHEDISKYDTGEVIVHDGPAVQPRTLMRFAHGLTKVTSVEGMYCPKGFDYVREAGSSGVLVANPELYAPSVCGQPDVVRIPTTWERHRMPEARVLPQPIALDRHKYRPRKSAAVFYHPMAPAFHDRNGTQLLIEALPHVRENVVVIIRDPDKRSSLEIENTGNALVKIIRGSSTNYWDAYPADMDVMIMPRRYGGLCLPVQEAAAMGVPALMLDIPPQREWPGTHLVQARMSMKVPMKGGLFPVYECQPEALAEAIDRLARDAALVTELSRLAYEWACERSWNALQAEWLGTCA